MDDQFWIMLLNHDFYGKFIQEKQIIDAQTTSGALISFSLESAEAVNSLAKPPKLTEATVTELIWEYQKSKCMA